MLRKDIIVPRPRLLERLTLSRSRGLMRSRRNGGVRTGQFKVVHKFNAARVEIILKALGEIANAQETKIAFGPASPDIGCGRVW